MKVDGALDQAFRIPTTVSTKQTLCRMCKFGTLRNAAAIRFLLGARWLQGLLRIDQGVMRRFLVYGLLHAGVGPIPFLLRVAFDMEIFEHQRSNDHFHQGCSLSLDLV